MKELTELQKLQKLADDTYWIVHERYINGSEDQRHWIECDYHYHNVAAPGATGWIQPNGKFHGCGFAEHAASAIAIHGQAEHDLEVAGWIKVCGTRGLAFLLYESVPGIPAPTRAQRSLLNKLGYADATEAAI